MPRRATVFALISIYAVCAALAVTRMLLVPIFQEPDEIGHLDYVMAIYDAGGLFRSNSSVSSTEATAQIRYLAKALAYRHMRYDFDAKAPAGYGTPAFAERVDRSAPPRSLHPPGDAAPLPYVATAYPVTYYLIGSAIASARDALFGPHLLEDAYAVRFFGLPLLAIAIASAYAIFRALGVPRLAALPATAAIGAFPTTTTIFTYVQPDAMTAACVLAATAFACRAIRYPDRRTDAIGMVVASVVATTVKVHYGVVSFVALGTAIACARLATRRPLRAWAIAAAVVAQAAAVEFTRATLPARKPYVFHPLAEGPHPGWGFARTLADSLQNVYFDGQAFRNFWYQNGPWLSHTYLPKPLVGPLTTLLVIATLAVAIVTALESGQHIARIVAQAQRVDRARLFKIFANPLVNVYVFWTGFLIAVDVFLRNQLGLLGRYWDPVMPAILAFSIVSVPGRAPFATRRSAAVAVAAGWCVFALALSCADIGDIASHYYGPPPPGPHRNPFIAVEDVTAGARAPTTTFDVVATRGEIVTVHGWGFLDTTGLPGAGATLTVDGTPHAATYGLPTPPYRLVTFKDVNLGHVGLSASIDTGSLAAGIHTLRLYVNGPHGERSAWVGAISLTVQQGRVVGRKGDPS